MTAPKPLVLPAPVNLWMDRALNGGPAAVPPSERAVVGQLPVMDGGLFNLTFPVSSGTIDYAGVTHRVESQITASGQLIARVEVPDLNGLPTWHECFIDSTALIRLWMETLVKRMPTEEACDDRR